MENNMLNLGDLLNLIKYPSLTEKSINLYGDRQYTFVVDRVLSDVTAESSLPPGISGNFFF